MLSRVFFQNVVLFATIIWAMACEQNKDECGKREDGTLFGLTSQAQGDMKLDPVPTIETYESCAELRTELMSLRFQVPEVRDGRVQTVNRQWPRMGSAGDVVQGRVVTYDGQCYVEQEYTGQLEESPASQASDVNVGTSEGDSFTNLQEQGVDESDFVKIADHHILVSVANRKIEVIDRKTQKRLGAIEKQFSDMYIYNDVLVLIHSSSFVSIEYYRLVASELPELIRTQDISSGALLDSRLQGDELLLVTQAIWQPVIDGNTISGIKCTDVKKLSKNTFAYMLTKINRISLESIDKTAEEVEDHADVVGILDRVSSIYMSEKSLYAINQSNTYDPWGKGVQALITRVGVDTDEKMAFKAAGLVDGHIKDQWALKEHLSGDVLTIAVTKGMVGSSTNHLFSLSANEEGIYEVNAEIDDLGPEEDIRAIRYIKDMAFIVTFKTTDPLYAIDLSDPKAPQVLGELKIDGFSMYLHPVDESRMLGVGYATEESGDIALYNGIQVSLYDFSNPLEPARIDNLTLGGRGSNSEVTFNHKAFNFNAELNKFSIPIITIEEGVRQFSGAAMFEIVGDKIVESGQVSHYDSLAAACQESLDGNFEFEGWAGINNTQDVRRLYIDGDHMVAVSNHMISFNDLVSYDTISDIAFGGTECLDNRIWTPVGD